GCWARARTRRLRARGPSTVWRMPGQRHSRIDSSTVRPSQTLQAPNHYGGIRVPGALKNTKGDSRMALPTNPHLRPRGIRRTGVTFGLLAATSSCVMAVTPTAEVVYRHGTIYTVDQPGTV